MSTNSEISIETHWVTKSGHIITYKAMETSHLLNTIRRCQSKSWRVACIPYLLEELRRRNLADQYPELLI